MATYVVSDIHGYYWRFMNLLTQVHFDPRKDELYVLGDIIDRGLHSKEMLEWAYDQPSSVHFLRGNHEDMMLGIAKCYQKWIEDNNTFVNADEEYYYRYDFVYNNVWTTWNGGLQTFEYLLSLPRAQREDILDWVERWPLFYDIEVNDRRFVLVHAGFAMNGMRLHDDRFERGINVNVDIKDFPTQNSQSLLWIRDNWFLDDTELPCDVIFGHTNSVYVFNKLEDMNDWRTIDGGDPIPIELGKEIIHFGKGLKKHCIDTGRSVMSILRLDDMKEFVSDIEE